MTKIMLHLAFVVGWFAFYLGPAHAGQDDSHLAKLIRDLDDERFRVRDRATRALEAMGDLPGPALRKALAKPISPEAKIRMERLLDKRAKFHADRAAADVRGWELAGHLLKAFQIIEKNHVTPASPEQLAVWSVQGMYREAKTTIPEELAGRLQKLGKANQEEIRRLLHDARRHLGWPSDFNDDKDFDVCLRAVFAHLEPGASPPERSCYIRPEDIPPCIWPFQPALGLV